MLTSFEYQTFLTAFETIKSEEINVLLVSGDVFDISNCNGFMVKLHLLKDATQETPDLAKL
jgi:hypothetical protein